MADIPFGDEDIAEISERTFEAGSGIDDPAAPPAHLAADDAELRVLLDEDLGDFGLPFDDELVTPDRLAEQLERMDTMQRVVEACRV